MGCFDTILLPCPKCGEIYEAQSKSGECLLHVYEVKDAPPAVMENVNRHAPFACFKCGTVFRVKFNPEIVETNEVADDFVLPEDESVDYFSVDERIKLTKAFVEYQSRLDKK